MSKKTVNFTLKLSMSKTKNNIEQEEIVTKPENTDNPESKELTHIEELIEQHQMRRDHHSMVEFGQNHGGF